MSDAPPLVPGGDPVRMLAALVEGSDDAIVGIDLGGAIVSWNAAASRLFGYAAGDVTGASMAVLIPADRAGELEAILDHVRAGRRVAPYDTVRLARDGRAVPVAFSACPLADAAGRIVGAAVFARDEGARLQADLARRTTEARWRAVIDSAVDGIIVIDSAGAVEAFNPAAERMFGYAEHEVLGRNVNVLMPPPYHEEHDGYIKRYLQTGEQKIIGIGREVTARRRDGTTFPVHLSVGELTVGGERHFAGILHDLSTRVALEERLREQTALARLGEMAAVIAHEVRNPLTAVRGAIQVIGGRLPAGSAEVAVIREILGRLDALNRLIDDLLLFARTPTPKLAPVRLGAVLGLTADLLAGDPAFSGVQVEIAGVDDTVPGDPELLKIAFQNLIINAAQAMQGRGTISATITTDEGIQRVQITDTGPGMAAETRTNLFRPFFTTKARGTGLGLATTKRLVEAHQGTIAVECPPGGGTIVTVELPRQNDAAPTLREP